MGRKKLGIRKLLIAVIVAGLVSGSGYAYFILYQERNQLQTDLKTSQRRAARLQGKVSEEKSKTTTLMRTKQSLEGRIRAMQTQIDQADNQKQALEEELANVEAKHAEKAKHLEKKIETLFERIDTIKASRDEVVARYKENAAIIKENEQKIAQLTGDLQRTDFELKRTGRQLANCVENNERLCLITEELVEKYENKGVTGSLMRLEPFTQIEKVELEKLVQEYTDRIEKERIE
jgi:chromosome segregation ATPase